MTNSTPNLNTPWQTTTLGNIPILLTFTHAGNKRIESITTKNNDSLRKDPGKAITDEHGAFYQCRDARTEIIADAMLNYFAQHKLTPYIVIPHTSRMDLDLNRNWTHNHQGLIKGKVDQSDIAQIKQIHDDYFDVIQYCHQHILDKYQAHQGFHFDFHGTALPQGVDLELGTLSGKAADNNQIYVDNQDKPTVKQALLQQDFNFAPINNEALEGAYVLEACGRHKNGINAIQVEIAQYLRGVTPNNIKPSAQLSSQQRNSQATITGKRLATAIMQLI